MTTANEQRPSHRPRRDLPQGVEPNAFAVWMKGTGRTVEEAAAMFEVGVSAVYGWRRGNRPPSRAMAARIEQRTLGAVPAGSWDR